MREETSNWLTPMLDAADLSDEAFRSLMGQATMPAAEAGEEGNAYLEWRRHVDVPGVHQGAVDWVRFGQVLRERLGWVAYPDQPPSR